MSHDITIATLEDVDEIMAFIGEHWKQGHILSRDKAFFLYEHQEGERVNFVIHRDENGVLDGILGFITASREYSDVWTVVWKALPNKERPMLGIELFEYLRQCDQYRHLLSPGINKKIIGIFKHMDIYTDVYKHYVLLNHKTEVFRIAKVPADFKPKKPQFPANNGHELLELTEETLHFDFTVLKDTIACKDRTYFVKRYFQHPIYTYKVYGISKDDREQALFVTREEQVGDASVLRIVDYIGDETVLKYVSKTLYETVLAQEYEYVDFMCFGFDEKALNDAGFLKVDQDSTELIVPNYFSPFVQENVKIHFFADTKKIENLKMCKADGDQDRPS